MTDILTTSYAAWNGNCPAVLTSFRRKHRGVPALVRKRILSRMMNHRKPIGSMYGIYANIRGILIVNVTIYGIHGSYGKLESRLQHTTRKEWWFVWKWASLFFLWLICNMGSPFFSPLKWHFEAIPIYTPSIPFGLQTRQNQSQQITRVKENSPVLGWMLRRLKLWFIASSLARRSGEACSQRGSSHPPRSGSWDVPMAKFNGLNGLV